MCSGSTRTNQVAELIAVVHVLQTFPKDVPLRIATDSKCSKGEEDHIDLAVRQETRLVGKAVFNEQAMLYEGIRERKDPRVTRDEQRMNLTSYTGLYKEPMVVNEAHPGDCEAPGCLVIWQLAGTCGRKREDMDPPTFGDILGCAAINFTQKWAAAEDFESLVVHNKCGACARDILDCEARAICEDEDGSGVSSRCCLQCLEVPYVLSACWFFMGSITADVETISPFIVWLPWCLCIQGVRLGDLQAVDPMSQGGGAVAGSGKEGSEVDGCGVKCALQ
ncbi:hypothetical protein IMY05_C4582000100 [Salix suchowensis]|nr:hypothetical protein IMY05_C4582000100 [Salix suchowensis]